MQRQLLACMIAAILLLASCAKDADYSDDTYFGGKVMILGHRGMGEMYKYPGNTLKAITPAIAIGADGCEVDIQLTSDTVLVLYHNDRLDGKTNCYGRIYESSWAEISQCEYNAIQNGIFVTSVDSLFSQIPDLNRL